MVGHHSPLSTSKPEVPLEQGTLPPNHCSPDATGVCQCVLSVCGTISQMGRIRRLNFAHGIKIVCSNWNHTL